MTREQTRRVIVDTLEIYGFHASARMAREEFDALLTELEQAERRIKLLEARWTEIQSGWAKIESVE